MENDVILSDSKNTKNEKKHIGNLKLSATKRAIKIEIFNPQKYYVIPLKELDNKVGKVFEYIDSYPEVVGEIHQVNKNTNLRDLFIKANIYHIKNTYLEILKNGSELVLQIFEE